MAITYGSPIFTDRITRADIEVMYAWGIKLRTWQRLTEAQRIHYLTRQMRYASRRARCIGRGKTAGTSSRSSTQWW